MQFDQRIQRLQQQIKDTKQAAIGTTPQGMMTFTVFINLYVTDY